MARRRLSPRFIHYGGVGGVVSSWCLEGQCPGCNTQTARSRLCYYRCRAMTCSACFSTLAAACDKCLEEDAYGP